MQTLLYLFVGKEVATSSVDRGSVHDSAVALRAKVEETERSDKVEKIECKGTR